MSETEFKQLYEMALYSIKCVAFHYWLKGYPIDEAIIKAAEALTKGDDKNV